METKVDGHGGQRSHLIALNRLPATKTWSKLPTSLFSPKRRFPPICIPGFSPFLAHLTRYYTLHYNLWFQQCVNQHSACMRDAFLPIYIRLAVLHSLCHLHHLRNQRVWVLILRYSRDIHFVTIIPIQIDTK